jgi:hypothetical protein
MKFIQISSLCILILIFSRPSQAQNYSNTLRETTWYCTCDFRTDSLAIFPSNTANYRFRLNFSTDGRLLLFDLKNKISNTTFSYTIKKSTINIFYNAKDSLADLNYIIRKNKETKSFDLSLYYDMRYKKLKASDKPPVGKFTLSKGKKTVAFEKMEDVTVYRTKKGLKHDSIEIISRGNFLEIRNDTLVLNAFQFSVHNFYKTYPDTNHFYSESLDDTLIRIKSPIKEITKIELQREKFNRVVNTSAIVALGVFFVSFPLAITVESSEAGNIFGQIAAYSAASIPVIITFNMAISKRQFQIAPSVKNKAIWKLDYKK